MTSEKQDTYQPGTLAVATVRGVPGVRIVRGEGHWAVAADTDDFYTDRDAAVLVTDIRPLVVLDLEGNDLTGLLRFCAKTLDDGRSGYEREASQLVGLADQIEAQTKPPRIPEPGLWGVVEANLGGDPERVHFVHHDMVDSNAAAWHETGGAWWHWSDLIDPVLIREGVQS